MINRTQTCLRPAAEPGCRPWCAVHSTETDACSSSVLDVCTVPGLSVWTSDTPALAPVIAVDGLDGRGRAFELALTPSQARHVSHVLQVAASLGGAA